MEHFTIDAFLSSLSVQLDRFLKDIESAVSHDKLKRIGYSVRVTVEMSVGHDYDKLKRIGHLVCVPVELSVGHDYDKLKRIGHLVRVPVELGVGSTNQSV